MVLLVWWVNRKSVVDDWTGNVPCRGPVSGERLIVATTPFCKARFDIIWRANCAVFSLDSPHGSIINRAAHEDFLTWEIPQSPNRLLQIFSKILGTST